ncbi:MAG TPA: alpha/beta hydrolase, partial [Mycobacterium sp.]
MPNSDVHPDLRRIARFAPRQMITPRTLRLVRALSGLRQADADGDVEVITLGSGTGVRLFRPVGVAEPAAALLWIHGGGYVIGTAQQDDRLCRRFSTELGITIPSVDYRLAQEHPYPAPL